MGIGGGDTKTGLIRDSYRCGSVCRRYPIPDAPLFYNFFLLWQLWIRGEAFQLQAFFSLGSRGYVGSDVSITVFCSARDV